MPQGHSPLGASGSHRWLVCSGSFIQSMGVSDEESDFAKEGTVAHLLGEMCLREHKEPWQFIGIGLEGVDVTKDMADAVDFYIGELDIWHSDRHQGNFFIEQKFHCPTIHKFFFGTSDAVYLEETEIDSKTSLITLHIWDYKHGAGIVVDAEDNPQLKYYAAGALEHFQLWNRVDKVVMHIVQPRGWHPEGPHRIFEMSVEDLDAWIGDVLMPAMDKALTSRDVVVGEHCRFCPARSCQCPALMDAVREMEELLIMVVKSEKGADALTPAQLGRLLELEEVGKIVFKAARTKAHGMLSAGKTVPGVKLVKAKTNRVYKKGAEVAGKKRFGNSCFTKPAFMSPAQIEALPGGKDFNARWAFKPEGATTVAVEADPRSRVIRDAKSLFTKKGQS